MGSFIIGVFGSIIASGVILFFMYFLKPCLSISNKISKTTYDKTDVYTIKVVNTGSRDAVAIKAELLIVEPQVVEGGVGYNFLRIPFRQSEIFDLRPISHVKEKYGAVFEFITSTDIESEWGKHDNSFLLFKLISQDSLSGFSKVFTAEYYSLKDIEHGRFCKGSSMIIGT